ncbi:uncharacterized protein LOC101971583 [Ictidomys tridecemlineatus]
MGATSVVHRSGSHRDQVQAEYATFRVDMDCTPDVPQELTCDTHQEHSEVVLSIEPSASCMLGKHVITELQLRMVRIYSTTLYPGQMMDLCYIITIWHQICIQNDKDY